MRHLSILVVLLVAPIGAASQPFDREDRFQHVRQMVSRIARSGKLNVKVVHNDLSDFKGKIIGVFDDYFVVLPKGNSINSIPLITVGANPNPKPRGIKIKYWDVLQMEGKDAVVSFVPDPASSPFASWDEIGSIGKGEFVEVHQTTNRKVQGVLLSSGKDSLSLMKGNREISIPSSQITKVYRIKGDTRSLAGKFLGGAEHGKEVAELILGDPRCVKSPIGFAIGAAIGAVFYVLPLGRPMRVLVYSQ